ncbi:hypothetical protein [Roseiconus lacunae]|uniref:MARVEL domain-containing protein n=1 Tax=Roseiconus lacunae TaxID=2605694 RepID=A0ABT7PG31_9BACT|nr:hypothetical protein [Roseiconus lacunae]MCD0462735.1 hypothetical protein [Roseiconus lacunae]MDM4015259.1 hypothetical protein [Roseiconus lacunae]
MQCPRCDTALRLEAVDAPKHPLADPKVLRRFKILDLLAFTALVAIHFAAFPVLANSRGSEWPLVLNFSPTAITCLLHLRLSLGTSTAMAAHYVISLVWSYLFSLGHHAAVNTYNPMQRSGGSVQVDVYAAAWDDACGMAIMGFAFAATYGLICYTALNAGRPGPQRGSRDKATVTE